MAPGDVLLVAEDFDVSSDEAVCDASAAVYGGAIHNDGVLYLCVPDSGVIPDARVGADVGVWAYVAVVADDGRASNGYSTVDEGATSNGDVVCYGRSFLYCSVVVWPEVVEDDLVRFEEEFGVCDE